MATGRPPKPARKKRNDCPPEAEALRLAREKLAEAVDLLPAVRAGDYTTTREMRQKVGAFLTPAGSAHKLLECCDGFDAWRAGPRCSNDGRVVLALAVAARVAYTHPETKRPVPEMYSTHEHATHRHEWLWDGRPWSVVLTCDRYYDLLSMARHDLSGEPLP